MLAKVARWARSRRGGWAWSAETRKGWNGERVLGRVGFRYCNGPWIMLWNTPVRTRNGTAWHDGTTACFDGLDGLTNWQVLVVYQRRERGSQETREFLGTHIRRPNPIPFGLRSDYIVYWQGAYACAAAVSPRDPEPPQPSPPATSTLGQILSGESSSSISTLQCVSAAPRCNRLSASR